MTTYDADLATLRQQLRNAAETDLRRARRRRRRLLQVTIIPAVLVAGSGVAAAVAPLLGEPAPAPVQQAFDAERDFQPGYTGAPLRIVAHGDGQTLYGAIRTGNGGWCLAVDKGPSDRSYNCQPPTVPSTDEVFIATVGGPSGIIAGRVGTPRAHSVEFDISQQGQDTRIDALVGRDGFFIAALPEPLASQLVGDSPFPSISGVARDAAGKRVAATDRP